MDNFDLFLSKLKCTICKNLMQIPKSLPCGHDVCLKCMQSYIFRTVPMAGYDLLGYVEDNNLQVKPSQKYFECPAEGCGKRHNPARPDKNTMYWAVDLDNSVEKIHLMELFNGKRRKDTKFCKVCITSPTPQPATVVCTSCCWLLCNKCTFIHRHTNPSHPIVELVIFENGSKLINGSKSESGAQKDTQREEAAKATDRRLADKTTAISVDQKQHCKKDLQGCSGYIKPSVCPIHRPCEEVLYCKDCDILCCIKCSDANHVMCKNVYSIQKLYKKMTDTRAYETLKTKTEALLEKCSTSFGFYKRLERKVTIIAQMQHETLTDDANEGKERVSGLVRRYDYLYNRAKRCVTQMSIVDSLEANEFIKMIFSVEKECVKLEDEFVKAVSNDSDVNLMVKMLEKELNVNKNKQEASVVDKVPRETLMSDSGTDLLKSTFGAQFETKVRAADATDQVEFKTNILAKSGSDKNDCMLIKCILLQSMDIIVADQSNKKIKLISDMQKIHEFRLESVPFSIAVSEPDLECFVSLPGEQKVIVMNISKSDLVLCSEIKIEKEVFDIGILDTGTLLCVGNGPEPFHQLYRNGIIEKVQHQGQFHENQIEMYQKASHLKVVEHQGITVYISDIQKNIIASYRMFRGYEDNDNVKEQKTKETEGNQKTDSQQRYSSLEEKNQLEHSGDYRESNSSESSDKNMCIDVKLRETIALNGKENGIINKDAITNACKMPSAGDTSFYSNNPAQKGMLSNVDRSGKLDTKSATSFLVESFELGTQNSLTEPRLDNVTDEYLDPSLKNSTAVSVRLHKQIEIPNPTGFDLDSVGNIYVCCNSQCEVLKFVPNRQEMFKILDIPSPRGLSVNQDKMILTSDSVLRKNCVMVYQFK